MTFSSVTSSGDTLIIATSEAPVVVPPEFDAHPPGHDATFFDVQTTATVSGDIETCVSYPDDDQDGLIDGTARNESAVRLLHEEGGTFVDRTSSIDTSANEVCASTTSLSYFATVVPAAGVPTLTPLAMVLLAAGLLVGGAIVVRLRGRVEHAAR